MTASDHILKADKAAEAGFPFRHPLDPSSGCQMTPLSRLAGAKAGAVNLVRIASMECAFPLHRHHGEEEWMFVIEGFGRSPSVPRPFRSVRGILPFSPQPGRPTRFATPEQRIWFA